MKRTMIAILIGILILGGLGILSACTQAKYTKQTLPSIPPDCKIQQDYGTYPQFKNVLVTGASYNCSIDNGKASISLMLGKSRKAIQEEFGSQWGVESAYVPENNERVVLKHSWNRTDCAEGHWFTSEEYEIKYKPSQANAYDPFIKYAATNNKIEYNNMAVVLDDSLSVVAGVKYYDDAPREGAPALELLRQMGLLC